jgi:hypothetical protein
MTVNPIRPNRSQLIQQSLSNEHYTLAIPYWRMCAVLEIANAPQAGDRLDADEKERCVAALLAVTQVRTMDDLQPRPDEMIHVRVPADLRAAYEREAEKENRTLSGQVRHVLAQADFAQQEPQVA